MNKNRKARATRRHEKEQRRLERKQAKQSRKPPRLVAAARDSDEVEWFRRDAYPFRLNKLN